MTRQHNPARPHGCALCRRTLNYSSDDGYRHALGAPQHPPIPVPLDQIGDPQLVCDHCGAADPRYLYTAAPLRAIVVGTCENHLQHLGEEYATCVPCAECIEAGDRPGLLRRALLGFHQQAGEPADALTREALGSLQHAFWDTLVRGRRPLARGLHRPAPPIRATILPKVRDRLAAWWRSDDPQQCGDIATDGLWRLPGHLATGGGDTIQPVPPGRALAARFTHRLAESLERARLLWVDATFAGLARSAAAGLPALPVDPALAGEDGLIVWAVAAGERVPAAASWTRIPGGWWVVFYTATGDGLHETALHTLRTRLGWLYPTGIGIPLAADGTPPDAQRGYAALLVATWILAGQPLATSSTEPADPAIRRAYARNSRPSPEVRIVRLRPRSGGTVIAGAPGRHYTHQWWVTGFWRQQPYGPHQSLRRPVYITGHPAGPPDKPLRIRPTVQVLGSTRTTASPASHDRPEGTAS
jgi:hypothetical protein